MIEFERDVRTADGAMNTFFACDAQPARKALVIVLMDAPVAGRSQQIVMADRTVERPPLRKALARGLKGP